MCKFRCWWNTSLMGKQICDVSATSQPWKKTLYTVLQNLILKGLYLLAVADLENFGGGDFKHKTSKIRMSSPKLRVIFRPKSEIQTFFSPKLRWSPKKKGLHRNWEWFFGRDRKFKRFFRPKSGGLQKKKKKGLHRNWEWFFGRNR